jgi:hypothetical protein
LQEEWQEDHKKEWLFKARERRGAALRKGKSEQ